jgi:NADH-ubiquinone/plastoquinone oxidoreductase chain 6.
MNLETILYLVAIGLAIFFSYLAIHVRSILYAVIFLVGMYATSTWALIQLGSWFLALVYLFIGAGGVLVLIIFASMLTRPAIDIPPSRSLSVLAFLVSLFFASLIFYLLFRNQTGLTTVFSSNYIEISKILFDNYAFAIIIIAIAALAVYYGAIYLASEEK